MSKTQQDKWNANAEAWVNHIRESVDPNHDEIILPSILEILGDVRGKRILDLACGEGILAGRLQRDGADVVGIDFSTDLIAAARKSYPEVQFIVGEAERVNKLVNENEFDVCVINMALFCMPDIELVLNRTKQVLKDNGTLVFSVLHPAFPLRIYEQSSLTDVDSRFGNPERIQWPETSYFNRRIMERRMTPDFPEATQVRVRMIEEYFECLRESGFVVSRLMEPRPTKRIVERTDLLSQSKYQVFPFFLIVEAIGRGAASSENSDGQSLIEEILEFRDEREWKQFQTVKNTAISISLESAELLEYFHWVDSDEEIQNCVKEHRPGINDELADLYINLKLIAHDLEVSLDELASDKLDVLRQKYSKVAMKGRAIKVSEKRKDKDSQSDKRFK